MDFHGMKRKQLQALCKKHNIPANLSNLEMANMITEFLKEMEDPLTQPIEGQDENVSETEYADVIVNRKVKKVRFSPEHELIEFTRSPEIKRSRRNTVLRKSSILSVENVGISEINKENLGGQGRVMRSRGLKSMEAKVNERNSGTNPEKCKDKNTNASAVEISNSGKLKEGDVDCSGKAMLLRGKTFDEGKKRFSKRLNERAKDDGKRDEKALENVDNEKLIEEIVDNPGRVTRSRVQKLTEVSARENRGRKVAKRIGNVAQVTAENEKNKVATDSGENVKSKGKGGEEVLENKEVEEHDATEPQMFLRRSKRNTNMVADPELLKVDKRKNENGESKGFNKKSKILATAGLGVDGEGNESEVNPGRKVSLKMKKPIKEEPRRSSRRKNAIEAGELKAETENKHSPRSSVPHLGTAGEDSKDEKKVLQPTGVTGRSRRKTLSVKLVSADGEIDTHLAVENLEAETGNRRVLRGTVPRLGISGEASKDEKTVLQPTGVTRRSMRKNLRLQLVDEENDTDLAVENTEAEKHKSKPCPVEKECSAVQKNARRSRRIASKCNSPGEIGGDSIIHQKNKVMKRKRAPISGDVIKTNNDPSSVAETIKETSNRKAVPAAATGIVADSRKRTCRLNDFKVLDASSHNGFETGELFLMNARPSASEGLGSTSNLGFSADTIAKSTHEKKPDISVADSAGSSEMKFINGKELVNSDTNAAARNTECKTDFKDVDDDQVSASSIRVLEKDHSPLEINVHELLEQNIKDIDKNDPEAHMLSETEDLGCNNKIDNQALPEGSNVSGTEGFDETGSSTDSLLRGDQTDIKTEAEEDKCWQTCPNAIDRDGEVKGISVQENLGSGGTRKDNQVLPGYSKFSEKEGFAETTTSADNPLPGDQTGIKTDVEAAEVEAEKWLQPNPCVVGDVKDISAQENLVSEKTGRDNQALPEVSNVFEKEGSTETGFSSDTRVLDDQRDITTDLEVAHAEADECLQPSSNEIDHIGEVKGISVEQNLDLDGIRQENQEGSNVSENKGFAETDSSDDRLLLGDQTDIRTDPGVAEAEGDKCLQPSPRVADQEIRGISVQENLDSDESHERKQANDMSSPVSCHHIDVGRLKASNNILDNNNEDTPPKAGAVESCGRPIDYTHSSSTLNLMSPSSCVLRRLEADNMAEGNEAFSHKVSSELAETDEDGSLEIHKSASYGSSAFGMLDLSDGDRSPRIVTQDRVIFPGEYPVMTSDKQGKCKDPLAIAPITIGADNTEINLMRGYGVDHMPEICIDKSTSSENGRTVEGESSSHESKWDEDGEFSVFNLFEAEGRPGIMPQDNNISGENSLKDFDEQEQGMFHGSPSVAPTTVCNRAGDHEVDLTAEGYVPNIYKDKQSETIDADESACLENHESSKDEDWEFTISNLFDGEGTARMTSQDRGIVSLGYPIMDLNKELTIPDFPAKSTTFAYNEVKFNADSSNLLEVSPSKPTAVPESQEQSKSPLAETTVVANTIQMLETWCNASETAGLAMRMLKSNTVENISQVVEGSSVDDDGNDAECGKEKEDCTISKIGVECLTDVKFQDREETEEQSKNMLERQTEPVAGEEPTDVESVQIWTEIELHNLFGTIFDNDTPGLNDTSSSGTEAANLTSTKKSITKYYGSLTKKEKELEGERSECERITYKTVVLPTSFSEISHAGFDVDIEENHLAIPVKIDETCDRDADLQRYNLSEKRNHLTACSEDGNSLREVSIKSFRGPLEAEVAEIDIFDGQKNVIDKGTSLCLFPKFPEHDEVTERGDSIREENYLFRTKIWDEKDGNSRPSQDIYDNSEDDHEKISREEESLTDPMVQLSMPQLHFEEKAEDFNNHIHTISDVPSSGCTETLKESDVADTIKEYIDSESSLSIISENSSVSFPVDVLCESNEDVAERFTNNEGEDEKQSVYYLGTESKEQEEAMADMEPAPGSGKAVNSRACVDFLAEGSTAAKPLVETKGFDVKLDSQKQIEAEGGHKSSKQLCSTAKKNARTILIHGTPGKLLTMADVKENAPTRKSSNVGDLTAVRPAKRRALRDIKWK